jgi:hypothetical protein
VCDDIQAIHEEVQGFYQQLYMSQGLPNMSPLLQFVQETVTIHMRLMLEEPFVEEEVKTALFQMHPSKSPGVDGFTAGFFSVTVRW